MVWDKLPALVVCLLFACYGDSRVYYWEVFYLEAKDIL